MGRIGVIGGSAVYEIEGLEILERREVRTPFGRPSDAFVVGKLSDREVVFLPRHGKKHTLVPSDLNYRANIYAFKLLGVDRIISVSAVGSLKEEIAPLDIVLVDQFIDRTNQARATTFFGNGMVAHVSFADPVCGELREAIHRANRSLEATVHNGGCYVNMEGPAFSTRAESYLYKSWGVDVIGMTNMAEARLAREAGVCYAVIAMVTDYDCWRARSEAEEVSVEVIIGNLRRNAETAKKMLKSVIGILPPAPSCSCADSLKNAIITPLDAVPRATLRKLAPILGKYGKR